MVKRLRKIAGPAVVVLAIFAGTAWYAAQKIAVSERAAVYIVQAETVEAAIALVEDAGGIVTDELDIITAVGALLTPRQVETIERLGADREVHVHRDRNVNVSGQFPESQFPTLIGAADLHAAGIDGRGVTIAVVDTGLWRDSGTQYALDQEHRLLAQYDLFDGAWLRYFWSGWWSDEPDDDDDDDDDGDDKKDDDEDGDEDESEGLTLDRDIDDFNGHGTHVTSVIANSDRSATGLYLGVAPGANIVAVRAFDAEGSGRYIDVIKAIAWVIANRDEYDIRVLNLSFSGEAVTHYWADPLNQAVMAAWREEIVVVAAAGNAGPAPMTVGVPGNVPYVITVGAMTDNYTPFDTTDDALASFSSAGPTADGFVKPEVVAPGGHIWGLMPPHGWIAGQHPKYRHPVEDYFNMSGTSQSTAVVSGVVALMLQVDPSLDPDEVKCRLMASARPARNLGGELAYSIFQQGAGLVNAIDAIGASARKCANRGLDVKKDTDGNQHYRGPVRVDETGDYYIVDPGVGDDAPANGDGLIWSGGGVWSRGAMWTRGGLWSRGSLWSRSYRTRGAFNSLNRRDASLKRPMSINTWVEPE